jgi:hypothetical protein
MAPTNSYVIKDYASAPGDCRGGKQFQQSLVSALPSSAFEDLVCYDALAWNARGISGGCSNYVVGTYQMKSRDGPNGEERTLVTIPRVKAFPWPEPDTFELGNSDMVLSDDEFKQGESHNWAVNIPGTRLTYNDGIITGDFGATLATVAASLPYEGELRFLLDTRCGWYYLQGAGSFTYFLRFSGQTFIVHAPKEYLRHLNDEVPNPIFEVSDIIEDLSLRALCPTVAEFERQTGLDTVTNGTVITGLLTAGNASYGGTIGPVDLWAAAGPCLYLFQFKSAGGSNYRIGTFMNTHATADFYTVGLEGYSTFPELGVTIPSQPVNSVNDLVRVMSTSDFKIGGRFSLTGCASAVLGHCEAGVQGSASFSTRSGFDFSGTEVIWPECDTGGCD